MNKSQSGCFQRTKSSGRSTSMLAILIFFIRTCDWSLRDEGTAVAPQYYIPLCSAWGCDPDRLRLFTMRAEEPYGYHTITNDEATISKTKRQNSTTTLNKSPRFSPPVELPRTLRCLATQSRSTTIFHIVHESWSKSWKCDWGLSKVNSNGFFINSRLQFVSCCWLGL